MNRTYWIQLCYGNDRPDDWIPSKADYPTTCQVAARLLIRYEAAFALVLKPWVRRGTVAPQRAILADFQRDEVPESQRLEVFL
jgi:hypothetical protein